jgi:SAM-dependent methyltransferase
MLPDEPVPVVDAIVSVGHVLNYLPDEGAIERALIAMAGALKPGGVVAFDLCDLEWGRARADVPPLVRRSEDWVLMTEFETPVPERFVRRMTTFVRNPDGSWRRDDEVHDNALVDVSRVPSLLDAHGVESSVRSSFAGEELPAGLMAVVGRRSLGG